MLYDRDQVVECPNCKSRAKKTTLASDNILRVIRWIDGKAIYPMLPESILITICSYCNKFYLLEDAKKIEEPETSKTIAISVVFLVLTIVVVGSVTSNLYLFPLIIILVFSWVWYEDTWFRYVKKLKNTPILSQIEIAKAIKQEIWKDRHQELKLRIFFWRNGNDKFRNTKDDSFERNKEEIENMNTLVEILDNKTIDERIIKIEILRELGKFEKAEYLIKQKFIRQTKDDFNDYWLEIIQKYVEEKNSSIFELPY